MFQYINLIPIHKHVLKLRKIKVIWNFTKITSAFAYKPPTPYRKHAYNTDDQLLCNVRNITVLYMLGDIGLYLLLSKFVERIQTVESRSSYMDHDQHLLC